MKECVWINNFEGENMKMFERREMQSVWLEMWALSTVPAVWVATDTLGYPRMGRVELSWV